jgi:hypothetical protein
MSAHQPHCTGRLLCTEGGATIGIDVQAFGLAPEGELGRVYYCPDDLMALSRHLGGSLVGSVAPLFVGLGQLVSIDHDGANGCVVFLSDPRDADGRDLAMRGRPHV